MKNIIISVVTIVYNNKEGIRQTIESVIGQDYPMVNYVIIDGKSTDGTVEIIKEYHNHLSVFISEKDSGIYDAMNKGMNLCNGEYVLFMNSGDIFSSPHVLSNLIYHIKKKCSVLPDLVYGSYMETSKGIVIPCRSYKRYWYGMFASHQSMLYNLSVIRKYGLSYDTSYKIAADYKFTLEVISHSSMIVQTAICVSKFDTTGISCQNPYQGMLEANRARKEVLNYNIPKCWSIILLLSIAHFIKRYFPKSYQLLRYS